jgi:superfamily II DNA or RNA helicase
MEFIPSIYQQKIFDFITKGYGSAVINAKAGSGKTTTIVEAMKLINNDKKVLYKDSAIHIATEAIGVERAEERFDSGMTTNQMIKSIMNDIHQFHGVNSNIAKEAMND